MKERDDWLSGECQPNKIMETGEHREKLENSQSSTDTIPLVSRFKLGIIVIEAKFYERCCRTDSGDIDIF